MQNGADVVVAIDRLFPEQIGHEQSQPAIASPDAGIPEAFDKEARPIAAVGDGYLQRIDALSRTLDAATSPLQRFEHGVQPWVAYAILPVFALFNAGVEIDASAMQALASAVPLGIIAGLSRPQRECASRMIPLSAFNAAHGGLSDYVRQRTDARCAPRASCRQECRRDPRHDPYHPGRLSCERSGSFVLRKPYSATRPMLVVRRYHRRRTHVAQHERSEGLGDARDRRHR